MQRRHFKAIALSLLACRPDESESEEVRDMWQRAVLSFVIMCKNENPNFKRDRFLKACGAAE